jgi:plastocyanin
MRNRSLIPLGLILTGLMLTSRTRVALGAGTVVEGIVKIAGVAPSPSSVRVSKDMGSCGFEYRSDSISTGANGGLANVVVSLRATKSIGAATPVVHATVDQIGCRYKPHVQAVGVGSDLTLVNSDRVLHNVHANSGPVTVFNFAMPIKGQKIPTKLIRPGVIRLQCDAGHTWMNAWIYVLDHAHYAVTDQDGHFAIHDVPPGEYSVEYWHEPIDGQGPGTIKTGRLVIGAKAVRADGMLKL